MMQNSIYGIDKSKVFILKIDMSLLTKFSILVSKTTTILYLITKIHLQFQILFLNDNLFY